MRDFSIQNEGKMREKKIKRGIFNNKTFILLKTIYINQQKCNINMIQILLFNILHHDTDIAFQYFAFSFALLSKSFSPRNNSKVWEQSISELAFMQTILSLFGG
jgi:hypothetical protein